MEEDFAVRISTEFEVTFFFKYFSVKKCIAFYVSWTNEFSFFTGQICSENAEKFYKKDTYTL